MIRKRTEVVDLDSYVVIDKTEYQKRQEQIERMVEFARFRETLRGKPVEYLSIEEYERTKKEGPPSLALKWSDRIDE